MTLAEITLLAFTLCNSLRGFAYLPQVWKVSTDPDGAKGVSSSTWTLLLVSHLTTAGYAIVNQGDWNLAYMFLINAAGCAAILLAAGLRRHYYQRKMRSNALVGPNVLPFRSAA